MDLVVGGTGRVHIKFSLCMFHYHVRQLKYISTLFVWNEMVENCQLHTLATFICTFKKHKEES
jgi:hypothetical protein